MVVSFFFSNEENKGKKTLVGEKKNRITLAKIKTMCGSLDPIDVHLQNVNPKTDYVLVEQTKSTGADGSFGEITAHNHCDAI